DLHYSAEHFTPALARRITSELEAVCCALAVSTATPLAAYLTAPASPPAASVDARVREWNHTAVPLDDALRAEAQVAARAARAPDSIALQTDAGALTYRELDARANRIANVLRAQGIGSGKLVG